MIESLLLATTNPGKVREMRRFLESLPIEVSSLADLPGIPSFPETGATFLENARGKSLYYGRSWAGLTLGEDSGLEIDALEGAPGVRSARFAGESASDADNIRKLLDLLSAAGPEARRARFVSCMVLSRQGEPAAVFTGTVEGRIATEIRGTGGFGYDPVFFYPPLERTFAELAPVEKNRISHRGRALADLKRWLQCHLPEV